MRYIYVFLLWLVFCLSANGQVTKTITIEGAIAKPLVVSFDNLKSFKSKTIDSLQILNHKHEYKSTLKGIKGVLLKDVLSKAEFSVNSPKVLSEFYIVCIADDGYKVVYSWNELFNSSTGDQTLIVTEVNKTPSINQKEGIMLLTPTDRATGRRYVKNFSKVSIQQIK
ncbi:molybdopterin-binding protein [Flavobacterium sp. DG1-102-2]|uniref:molybdopterin-binding protein n=1 Tax=Flavobacterium sp. DG1-102-2 TaxID=3081663 RepID=UPI002948EEAD|nr:molybdopterin-binding protein [Flavobacterium sp. DG1-102-2]MDV6167189.1 molybdopterin-binding protein [Flavobacterium sp. DG1-102-2]